MMDPQTLADKLKELDEDFAAAPEVDDDPFALPEPGVYQTVLTSIDYFEAKTGDPFLKWVFTVTLDPTYAGRNIDLIYNMGPAGTPEERQKRLGFLKRDLLKLGIDPNAEDFSLGLLYPGSPIWDEVLDAPCIIAVVDSKKTNPHTGKPYRNAYLNERLGDPLPSDIPSDGVAPLASQYDVRDDELPF